MSIVDQVKSAAVSVLKNHFSLSVSEDQITVNNTKPDFEGDYTIVLFSLVKLAKKPLPELGNAFGSALLEQQPGLFSSFNVVNGFLNLTIQDSYWLRVLFEGTNSSATPHSSPKKIMVEYSSPNTNKPLHLGHLRNNFLGWSVSEILKHQQHTVIKTSIVNDRGIHICKSMIAWQLFADGATPESTGTKGDHFIGDYYVRFNDEYKKQIAELIESGMSGQEAEKQAPIMKAAQQMLVAWEAGDAEVIDLWKRMNSWVYKGFDETYATIGSDFDVVYYESDTYLLGKRLVEIGLEKNIFYTKPDGSVWIDLTADGLDEKIVQRSDGTSVYITQDIGLMLQRQERFNADAYIYVIGDEQNYHMKVLKLICQKLGIAGADGIFHLSYGMVELPSGKMKSREGTVVDADEIVAEMKNIAAEKTKELGKVSDFTSAELDELFSTIGLGALKFFLLRVDPKKKIIFNPEESIDFHGYTAPFVQYTYARIKSILRKTGSTAKSGIEDQELHPLEKALILQLEQWNTTVAEAAAKYDPSVITMYLFLLAKTFNSFYAELSVASAENDFKKRLRIQLCSTTAATLQTGMRLLGIDVPERM